jgi:DNA-binding response OmpR family regulator
MKPYKILVVEDDPNISELMTVTMSSPSHAISCVDNGTEALAKLVEEKPDLVLLDVLIPEPDGWEIYKTIRSSPELIHTRVIIITALLFTHAFLRSKNIAATDMVMKKPFELDELRLNVKSLLTNG